MGREIFNGRARDPDSVAERLNRVSVHFDTGIALYSYADVCFALGLDEDRFRKCILPENKVIVRINTGRFCSKRCMFLNRAGVETLVMMTPGLPLRATMESLQEA